SAAPVDLPRSDGNPSTATVVPADEVGLPVYYPGTTDSSSAVAIDLKPGVVYSGVDLTILSVHGVHVRGRLFASTTGQTPKGGSVMLISRSPSGPVSQRNTPYDAITGEFDFQTVAPGSYDVVSVANEPNTPGVAGRMITRVPIEVGNVDIDNLALVLQPG